MSIQIPLRTDTKPDDVDPDARARISKGTSNAVLDPDKERRRGARRTAHHAFCRALHYLAKDMVWMRFSIRARSR